MPLRRRSPGRPGLPALLLLAALVLIAVVTTCWSLAAASGEMDDGVAHLVRDTSAAESGLSITTRTADDPLAQEAAAEGVLANLAGIDTIAMRLTYPLATDRTDPAAVVLAATTDLTDLVTLTAGVLPQPHTGDAPLQVLAPAAAGLAVGDTLTLGERASPVEVTGVWEPLDPSAPLWFADPGVVSGTMSDQDGAIGPLFVAEPADLLPTVERARERWVLTPGADLRAADLRPAASALSRAGDQLQQAGAIVQGAAITGHGPATLTALADHVLTLSQRARAAAVVLAIAAATRIGAISGLLARQRAGRTRLLLARGGRWAQLLATDLPGIALAAGLGGALGAGVALLPGTPGAGGGALTLRVALAVAGFALVAVSWLSRRRLAVDRSALERRGLVPLAGRTLLVVLTALALWRLLRTGLLGESDGDLDLLAAAALPLLLALTGLVLAPVLRPVAHRTARVAGRLGAGAVGLVGLLGLRRLGAHPRTALAAAAALAGGALWTAGAATDRASTDALAGALVTAWWVSAAGAVLVTAGVAVTGWLDRAAAGVGLDARIAVSRPADRAAWALGDLVTLVLALAAGAALALALVAHLLGPAAGAVVSGGTA